MKRHKIFKIIIIAVILTAGAATVINIPSAIEGFLPVVQTVKMTPIEYHQTVTGTGVIKNELDESGNAVAWLVTVSVSESEIRRVQVGQNADISGAAFESGEYTATVYEVGNIAIRTAGEYTHETVVEVVLRIDNPSGELRAGYTARADIKTAPPRTVDIIPYSAIKQDGTVEYVLVLNGNTAVRKDIKTGLELSQGAEVVSGLGRNQEIILHPEFIEENSLVTKNQGA